MSIPHGCCVIVSLSGGVDETRCEDVVVEARILS